MGGRRMPKEAYSWVYVRSLYAVPLSALLEYDKTPTRLCMTKASLDDLVGHMTVVTMSFQAAFATWGCTSRVMAPTVTTTIAAGVVSGQVGATASLSATPATSRSGHIPAGCWRNRLRAM